MKRNVIILGGKGQLGQSLLSIINSKDISYEFNFVFLSSREANITNLLLLEDTFIKYQPKYIINCAAYTQVDLAEDFKEEAYSINTIGTKIQRPSIFCQKWSNFIIC